MDGNIHTMDELGQIGDMEDTQILLGELLEIAHGAITLSVQSLQVDDVQPILHQLQPLSYIVPQ